MSRRQKYDDEVYILIFREYVIAKGKGDKPNFSDMARFGEQLGYNVQYLDFIRRENVKKHITEYYEKSESTNPVGMIIYDGIDVEEFLRRYSGGEKLKKALIEREGYYQEWAGRVADVLEAGKENITKYKHLKGELEKAREEINKLMEESRRLRAEKRRLEIELKIMTKEHNHTLTTSIVEEANGSVVSEKVDVHCSIIEFCKREEKKSTEVLKDIFKENERV